MNLLSARILSLTLLLSGLIPSPVPHPIHAGGTEGPLPRFWVNDDLEKGLSRARKTGKPLLIVFRCPP